LDGPKFILRGKHMIDFFFSFVEPQDRLEL